MHYTSREVYEYISKQTNDPIVEWKTCRISGTQFPIYQSDLDFYAKISRSLPSPFGRGVGGEGFQIPTPTLCPELRHMRRMTFRNDRTLYQATCSATGQKMISMFDPKKGITVYHKDYWWSDQRNALDYGRDFDPQQPFFAQWKTLFDSVPMPSLLNVNSHNAEYVNQTGNMKNCYLMFSCMDSEDCYYGNRIFNCSRCSDCSVLYESQQCYECIDSKNLFNCAFCQYSSDCAQSRFLFDCIGCQDCFGCRNLRGKQYYLYNEPYSKEEYERRVKPLLESIKSHSKLQKLIEVYRSFIEKNAIHRNVHQDQCEGCIGGFLKNSSNVHCCFESSNLQDCGYGLLLSNVKDIYDSNNTVDASLQYEVSTGGINAYNQLFCLDTRPNGSHLLYCAYCASCSHCFGCVGLKNKEYCILNKQYTKEEYEKTVSRIIEHMQLPHHNPLQISSNGVPSLSRGETNNEGVGTPERGEFFDPSFSHFGYNESAAFEYFPIDKEQAKAYGFTWHEKDERLPGQISFSLPDNIGDVEDSIVDQVLVCSESGKNYKITKQELTFYRHHGIALPRFHSDIRHAKRFESKPERRLSLVTDSRGETLLSVYPQDAPFKVYSEEAFKQEMYS